jgi:signal peptidase II
MRLVAPKLFYRMCGLSAVVVLLDQASKFLVFRVLMEMESEIVVLPVFSLVKRYNTGISFSILATDHAVGPWVFALLATIIAFGLLIWLSQTAEKLPAIGNVIDRVREGAVMDFLLFHWKGWAWPAFNVADSAITIGVALLIYDGVFGGKKRA